MRLGIGGSLFGVRGGISTRGIGVGVGPISAGTSWRGRGSRGGSSAGFWGFAVVAVVLFLVIAWPYLLGTYVAVQCGAWNPSTTRLVAGWCFEVVYLAVVVGLVLRAREIRARGAAEEAQRMAALIASGAVYEAKHGRSVVYRHGTCTTNHKSSQTATNCSRSSSTPPVEVPTPIGSPQSGMRPAIVWPAAILAVGLIAGLCIQLADPIHSPAGDAASKPCPAQPAGSSAAVTMPDLVGQNAGSVETRLKGLGLTSVELTSANPAYKSVWVPSNWTVVSTDPAPGCAVNSYYSVVVYVTK